MDKLYLQQELWYSGVDILRTRKKLPELTSN